MQQLREAFPFEASHQYLIFDRDQKFGFEVIAAVKASRIIPKRTSFRSPWQNGIAERWVGSCRRDLLDHIVALNERHLKRLLSEYVRYHHEDRTHLGLEKGTPDGRIRSVASGSFHGCDSVGCTIVTIERPSPDRLSAGPLYIYARSTCTRVHALQSLLMLYRGDDPIQDRSTKNRPVFGLSSSFGEPQRAVRPKSNRSRECCGCQPWFSASTRFPRRCNPCNESTVSAES
jgi:hypothetical protein